MGLELLEERYGDFIAKNPECVGQLKKLADHSCLIQLNMRALLDEITARVCPDCAASCCQCMPIEGWFTESDYFIYRANNAAPFNLRVAHGLPNGCAFLGPSGCVLPPDSRPFPCVKVNCKTVSAELDRCGAQETFTKLYESLDSLQEQLWYLIHPEAAQKTEPEGDAA
jgi:hypothetical protein